ncbi:MAG: hypothetical protein L6R42_000226 [Xanthoria sp. 1 TBL-2021]|nr:MAG: hypothetical protein L6R42_000226 [Xanthoria sp. 1 TBL-2021]
MLQAAAPTEEYDALTNREKQKCVLTLLAHDRFATLPQSLAKTILPSTWSSQPLNYKYVNVLLDRGPDLQFPSDFLWPLIKGLHLYWYIEDTKECLELFKKHNKRVELNGDMRKAIDDIGNLDPELKALIYKIGIQTD